MSTQAVLFIHHANDMYGADIGLLHSIKCLDRNKYFPIVILPSDMPPPGMLSSELERLGIEYHFAPLGILRRKYLSGRRIIPLALELMKGIAYVRNTARKRGVAFVYINTIVTVSGAIGGRLAGVPVLWHIREILSMPRLIRWALHNALSLCADRIVCISGAVRDSLLKEAPYLAGKSVVVYNAVSVAPSLASTRMSHCERSLGCPKEPRWWEWSAELLIGKDRKFWPKLPALVLQNHPDAHFVAVGSYFADESHYLRETQVINQQPWVEWQVSFGRLPAKRNRGLPCFGCLCASIEEARAVRSRNGRGYDARTCGDCH